MNNFFRFLFPLMCWMIYASKGVGAIEQNSLGRLLIIGLALPGLAQTYWSVFLKSNNPVWKLDIAFFAICVGASIAFFVHVLIANAS